MLVLKIRLEKRLLRMAKRIPVLVRREYDNAIIGTGRAVDSGNLKDAFVIRAYDQEAND